jgi:hypothetical protein
MGGSRDTEGHRRAGFRFHRRQRPAARRLCFACDHLSQRPATDGLVAFQALTEICYIFRCECRDASTQ